MIKRLLILLSASVFLSLTATAQLDVFSNNNVGIGGLGSSASQLSINTIGAAYTRLFVNQSTDGNGYSAVRVVRTAPLGFFYAPAMFGSTSSGTTGIAIGIYGLSNNTALQTGTSNVSIGVYGKGGESYINYGICGQLRATGTNGAGVFGTDKDGYFTSYFPSGRWAGYYYGRVMIQSNNSSQTTLVVDGTCTVGGVAVASDERLKTNITALVNYESISKLKLLRPVRYDKSLSAAVLSTQRAVSVTDTLGNNPDGLENNPALATTTEIGLLAQEVETVFPELVSTDENGIKAINYIALIPVTIQAIKEQDAKIQELERQLAALNEIVQKLKK